jgi:hypothetical protein
MLKDKKIVDKRHATLTVLLGCNLSYWFSLEKLEASGQQKGSSSSRAG